jgi:response regulator RpfG family c-di-GMP phosphodiesterase
MTGINPQINHMKERILCVDDEPWVLQGYQRALHKQFNIDIATDGEEALRTIVQDSQYAVIVADMRMPGMNGIQLLVKAREVAPDMVRMMLTGNSDQQTALDAVNEGYIFRFLTKPCQTDIFAKALKSGIEQYRLIMAERELLTQTLNGSIKVMTDVLGLINPEAFGRSSRVHRLVRQICQQLGLRRAWMIETAAMLSLIGCIAIHDEKTLSKVFAGQDLSDEEEKCFLSHPETARELLKHIPRLEDVIDIIVLQNDLYKNDDKLSRDSRPADVVLGGNILKLALDWDTLVSSGISNDLAMAEINGRTEWYHPDALAALRRVKKITDTNAIQRVQVDELCDGAVLADDIRLATGALLCAKGQEVTPSMRARLSHYVANMGMQIPIRIFPYTSVGIIPEQAISLDMNGSNREIILG